MFGYSKHNPLYKAGFIKSPVQYELTGKMKSNEKVECVLSVNAAFKTLKIQKGMKSTVW